MNKNQKIILAIFLPIMIFFITLTISYYMGVTRVGQLEKSPQQLIIPLIGGKLGIHGFYH